VNKEKTLTSYKIILLKKKNNNSRQESTIKSYLPSEK